MRLPDSLLARLQSTPLDEGEETDFDRNHLPDLTRNDAFKENMVEAVVNSEKKNGLWEDN